MPAETPPDEGAPIRAAARLMVDALGAHAAYLAAVALRAGWLTPREAAQLEPLAAELGRQLGEDLPAHRAGRAGVTP
jgi:hypothetical protein